MAEDYAYNARPSKRLDRASTERPSTNWPQILVYPRPSKRLDRASTERPGEPRLCAAVLVDHQNDSTERVLKGRSQFLPVICGNDDHQNDSTERVLKEKIDNRRKDVRMRPSKRLDRASTESQRFPVPLLQVFQRPSKRLDRASTERNKTAPSPWILIGTIKTTRQSEY